MSRIARGVLPVLLVCGSILGSSVLGYSTSTAETLNPRPIAVDGRLWQAGWSPDGASLLVGRSGQEVADGEHRQLLSELWAVNEYIRWPYESHVSVDELQRECPVPGVRFFLEPYSENHTQIRVECVLPNSVSVEHHPFADEAASLVEAIQQDAQSPLALPAAAITHRMCFAADRSAAKVGVPIAVEEART